MKTFPSDFSWSIGRRGFLTPLFFIIALAIAYVLAGYIVSGDLMSLAFVAMIAAGTVAAVAILRNWRDGAYLVLAWLLYEDLARKFLGNNMAIYFAKDFLLAVVYLSFFNAWRRKDKDIERFRPPFSAALLVFVWFGIMQVFNPASTSIFYGLMGIKLYFYYIPLMIVGYAMISSEEELRKFFFINIALMLIIGALGIAQSILGPRFLNPQVIADDIRLLSETYRVAPISGAIIYRPTSVFVSTGRLGDLLIVAWILVFGFSGYLLLRHRRGRIFAFLALTLMAAACVMSSSRGVFMWTSGSTIVGSAAFIWGAPWKERQALRVVRTLQRVALGIALAVVLMLLTYPEAFLNRLAVYSETLDPRSPTSELVHRSRDYPLKNFLAAFDYPRWPYGYGIGTVSLGGQYVARFFNVHPTVTGVESGFGAIIVEMGIGGLVLWFIMATAVLVSAWRVVKKLKGSPWFPLAFMIFLYSFLLLVPLTFAGLQPYQDFILNAYHWLLLGILFRLPKLGLSVQFANVAVPPSNPRWVP